MRAEGDARNAQCLTHDLGGGGGCLGAGERVRGARPRTLVPVDSRVSLVVRGLSYRCEICTESTPEPRTAAFIRTGPNKPFGRICHECLHDIFKHAKVAYLTEVRADER